MNGTLYLHIGSPKAASSTIQHYLIQQAGALRNAGYTVLGRDLQPVDEPNSAIWTLQELFRGDRKEARATIEARLAAVPTPHVILSAENLNIPGMADMFRGVATRHPIRVLYVVRRQDSWTYSAWKQWHSKAGLSLDGSVAMVLDKHRPNYPATVDAWAEVVGADAIRIASLDFPEEQPLHQEIRRWLEIESDELLSEPPGRESNPSHDYRIISLLSRHHEVFESVHDNRIDRFLRERSRLALRERYRLPPAVAERILEHFREDNRQLLGEERAAKLTVPETSERRVAEDGDRLDDHDFLLATLLEALGSMHQELRTLRRRVAVLESEKARK